MQNWVGRQPRQSVVGAVGRHWPELTKPDAAHRPLQVRPQPPQCAGSCFRSAQRPLQHVPGLEFENPPKPQAAPVLPGAQRVGTHLLS